MRLIDALRLEPGRSLALTGAGGKSSALAVLAAEARGRLPIVLTTTTRLGLGQRDLAEAHVVVRSADDVAELRLEPGRAVLVTGGEEPTEGKLLGLWGETLEALASRARAEGALLAVEADGARGRRLKAPADHEPMVPGWIDTVAPVVGLSALGTGLDEHIAHRPDRIARLLSIRRGDPLTAEHVASLVTSPQAGLKGVPEAADVRVLLNEAGDHRDGARRIAGLALRSSRIRSVVSADLGAEPPVFEAVGRVAGVVLAAGAGRRLGAVKPAVEWAGRPLVAHVVRSARRAGLGPVVVVTGAEAGTVRGALRDERCEFVHNEAWAEGQSTSVRAGLAAVEAVAEGVVFLLADMPKVSAGTITRLIEAHATTLSAIVAPVGGGRRGNPVLFDRATFTDLHALQGDEGGRSLLDRFAWEAVEADPEEFFQVESPDDLARLRGGG